MSRNRDRSTRLFLGDMDAYLLSRLVVVGEPVEARGRSSGDERAGLEPAHRRALPPDGPPEIGDRPVGGDNHSDQEQCPERDRSAELPEEARGGLGNGAANKPTGDVVAHVVARQPKKGDDDDKPADYWEHGLPADEAEPELEGGRTKRDRDEPGRPPEPREERRAPP